MLLVRVTGYSVQGDQLDHSETSQSTGGIGGSVGLGVVGGGVGDGVGG